MSNEFALRVQRKFNEYVNSVRPPYILPEHLIYCMKDEQEFIDLVKYCGANFERIGNQLEVIIQKLNKSASPVHFPKETVQFKKVIDDANEMAGRDGGVMQAGHYVLAAMQFDVKDGGYANYLFTSNGMTKEKIQEYVKRNSSNGQGTISQYSVNMNELAKQGKFSKLIGRQKELSRIIQILHKKRACNPVLLGNSGSGKTAIVEGLASRIVEGDVPEGLKDSVIYSVSLGSMIAGTRYRGEFEERLTKVIKEITEDRNAIIFIDEIHTLCGAGSGTDSTLDASNILKPYLTNRTLKCIGATTYDEYRKTIEKDKALARRFKKVDVNEPSMSETLEIIKGLAPEYGTFHHVTYTPEALEAIVNLTDKYMTGQYFPDKAIEVMDELGTKYHSGMTERSTIEPSDVEELVSMMANVPSVSLQKNETEFLRTLSDDLKKEIYNQDEAIDKIVRHIKIAKAGLGKKGRPLCVYGLCGPTGCGKSELVKQIASRMGVKFLRFDMSEYSEKHSVAKLIGAPPGYVGYEQPGILTEAVIHNPSSVILFDEIEKADESIYNLFLQMMDDGRLTDNNGRTAMFMDTVIFMTSNAGSKEAQYEKKPMGFGNNTNESDSFKKAMMGNFPPEFRNRFTEIINFNGLDVRTLEMIVDKEMRRVNASLYDKGISVHLTDRARTFIAEKADEEHMGGRPVERLVNTMVSEKIVDSILFDNLSKTDIFFDLIGDELQFMTKEKKDVKKKKDLCLA